MSAMANLSSRQGITGPSLKHIRAQSRASTYNSQFSIQITTKKPCDKCNNHRDQKNFHVPRQGSFNTPICCSQCNNVLFTIARSSRALGAFQAVAAFRNHSKPFISSLLTSSTQVGHSVGSPNLDQNTFSPVEGDHSEPLIAHHGHSSAPTKESTSGIQQTGLLNPRRMVKLRRRANSIFNGARQLLRTAQYTENSINMSPLPTSDSPRIAEDAHDPSFLPNSSRPNSHRKLGNLLLPASSDSDHPPTTTSLRNHEQSISSDGHRCDSRGSCHCSSTTCGYLTTGTVSERSVPGDPERPISSRTIDTGEAGRWYDPRSLHIPSNCRASYSSQAPTEMSEDLLRQPGQSPHVLNIFTDGLNPNHERFGDDSAIEASPRSSRSHEP